MSDSPANDDTVPTTHFRIVQAGKGFAIETNGERGAVDYVTKEAAFEAVGQAVHAVMSDGQAIEIRIPGGPGRWPVD